jgi:flagellar motor component MotA
MEQTEFVEKYMKIMKEVLRFSNKARHEGLLALEESLDKGRESNRDIFMLGMRFSLDGTDYQLIDKILSNIIKQEKDEYEIVLKTIQKEGVLSIHDGLNPWLTYCLLNSYTDIPISEKDFEEIYDKSE